MPNALLTGLTTGSQVQNGTDKFGHERILSSEAVTCLPQAP